MFRSKNLVAVVGLVSLFAGCGDSDAPMPDTTAREAPPSLSGSPSPSASSAFDAEMELLDKCERAFAATLRELNPQWRKLVLDQDSARAQGFGASGWLLVYTQAETTAQAQGCVGDLDSFAPLRSKIDLYQTSVEYGFPNPDIITEALTLFSGPRSIEAP